MTSLTGTPGQHGPAAARSRGPAPLPGPRTRLCAGAVVLLFTAVAARGNRVSACEERTFRAINGLPDALYPPGWVVMQLGTLGAAPATAGAAWLAGDRKLAGRLLAGGSITWLLAKGVKRAVGRDRPASLLPGTRGRGGGAAGLGYLSGHAGVAFALGAAALPRLNGPGRLLVLGATPTVALTRVYVGAHLPLDIVGGAALGLAVEAGLAMLTARPREAGEEAPEQAPRGHSGQPDVVAAARSRRSSARVVSGLCASLAGHHIQWPRSRLSAVTSTDRTTIVSSRMPNATVKPISVRVVEGIVARTAKVAASTQPAEVITPPVAASAVSAPCRASRLIASSRTRVIRKML